MISVPTPVCWAAAALAVGWMLLAVWAWRLRRLQRQSRTRAHLPGRGRVVDVENRQHGGMMVDPAARLRGVLDGVLDDPVYGLVPVEHKPRAARRAPYPSEIAQLTAEAMLLESVHALPERDGGWLVLGTTPLWVPISRAWRRRVSAHIAALRTVSVTPPPRSHDQPARCRQCAGRAHCDQALR